MIDLQGLNQQSSQELKTAFEVVLTNSDYINGAAVTSFLTKLKEYVNSPFAVGCGNGTDALQLALMALDLPAGAEVIVPAFNYVSAAEAVALMGFKPVFADVDAATFNLDPNSVRKQISTKTAAIIPVHLFGQVADMASLSDLAAEFSLYIIEDNAQSLGAECTWPNITQKFAGTIGHLGITSFFPTKMLGGFGDGGAVFTQDEALAIKVKQIASHGQKQKYNYTYVGINSRLDTLQAALLEIKLPYLRAHIKARQNVAAWYQEVLADIKSIILPATKYYSTHVYNQYTIRVPAIERDALKQFLIQAGIPTVIYYPAPLHLQPAYQYLGYSEGDFPVSETLCRQVLSLPMHPLLTREQVNYIGVKVRQFFN